MHQNLQGNGNLNKKLAVLSEDELKEEELAQAVGGGISPSINAF